LKVMLPYKVGVCCPLGGGGGSLVGITLYPVLASNTVFHGYLTIMVYLILTLSYSSEGSPALAVFRPH
jgi:hypothetical protein